MEEILIIAVCLTLNAFFSAFEMAFVSLSKADLRKLARAGDATAKWLLERRENPERTLSIIQIGITLVGALAAAVGGVGAAESIQPYFMQAWGMREVSAEILAILLIVVPLTYFSVVVGELVPKTLALRNPLKIVLLGARWLAIADRVLSPLVSLLEDSTKKIVSVFFKRDKKTLQASETTIEIDALSPLHQQYVLNLTHIERRRVGDVMLPWTHVNFIRSGDSMDEVATVIFSSGHTRLPVIDNGSVIGILHTKELLSLRETGERQWQTIIRPALKVQISGSVLAIFRLMQEKRSHMAVVFSSTGERCGIITLEDIMEEIVGDIYDEDDDNRIKKVFTERVKSKLRPLPPERKIDI